MITGNHKKNIIHIKSRKRISVGSSVKIKKNIVCLKKIIFGILLHVIVKIANMLEVLLIIQWSYVMKSQKRQKLFQQKLFQQKLLGQISLIFSPFLLFIIALLIVVSIYCYLIKYKAKEKHLLRCYFKWKIIGSFIYINKYIINVESNDKLKENVIKNRTCYYFEGIIKIKDW